MSGKSGIAHWRVRLFHECTVRNLSDNTLLELSKIIEKVRLNGGDKEAESKAEELLQIVEQYKMDEAILEAIKGM